MTPRHATTKDCLVNSRELANWIEWGLKRYRTIFSAVNLNPGTYASTGLRTSGAVSSRATCSAPTTLKSTVGFMGEDAYKNF
ncbi:hypothetical protein OQA88_9228 [Cercophora sp. LCS_1]